MRLQWVAIVLVTLALALAGCGRDGPKFRASDVTGSSFGRDFALTDHTGKARTLADFRGQTVLVSFAFGHCATVCPAIVSGLRAARRVARRPDVPLVVITMDPWRDTPDRLAMLVEHWELAAGDRVLSGNVLDVESALDALGIVRQRNETTGDIVHIATVMVLNESGRIEWRIDGGWDGVRGLLDGSQ